MSGGVCSLCVSSGIVIVIVMSCWMMCYVCVCSGVFVVSVIVNVRFVS